MPAAPLRALRRVELYGYPITVEGAYTPRQWTLLAGNREPRGGAPALLHAILENPPHAPLPKPLPGRLIVGDEFTLDCTDRVLRCRLPASGSSERRRLNDARESLCRHALFALGLLAERLGPRAVSTPGMGRRVLLNLHASSVLGRGGALVFCGRSGFGKTTLATQLLSGAPQIEYDLTQILLDPSGREPPRVIRIAPYLKRSFAGTARDMPRAASRNRVRASAQELAHSAAPPLAGLFWLQQAPSCALEPLPAADAAAYLLPPLHFASELRAVGRRLSLLRALLKQSACRRFRFPKSKAKVERFLKDAGYL
ncbi:MAG: hypothetical protein HS116_24445 [Planctomycetes bacterium]|nr:hypothetical protein [Planctomycetota bacterium]